jgi:hypothetical protein
MMSGFKKYFFVLVITTALFAAAWYASNYFSNRKIADIKKAQDQVTIDIMSSQTQFDLLSELSCQDVSNTYLSQEISDLADKISYAEQNLNDQSQVTLLKQQYSILEVKDFLLAKRISDRCKSNIATILYFYGNEKTCIDCVKQGYILDALRQAYPQLRVYSFDAGLDSSTIRALLTIYKIPTTTLPALVINGKTASGFMNIDDVKKSLPSSLINPPKAKPAAPVVSKPAQQ